MVFRFHAQWILFKLIFSLLSLIAKQQEKDLEIWEFYVNQTSANWNTWHFVNSWHLITLFDLLRLSCWPLKRRLWGDLGFSRKRETLRCSGSLMAGPRGSLAPIILNSQTQTCSSSHTFSSSSSASSTLLLFLLLLSTSSSFPSLTMVSLCPTPSEHPSAGNMIKVIWSL